MNHDPVMTHTGGENSDPNLNRVSAIFSAEEQEFAAALLAVGGVADRAMVCRAQRLVREQAVEIAERGAAYAMELESRFSDFPCFSWC